VRNEDIVIFDIAELWDKIHCPNTGAAKVAVFPYSMNDILPCTYLDEPSALEKLPSSIS
jgi:hypothetical protein